MRSCEARLFTSDAMSDGGCSCNVPDSYHVRISHLIERDVLIHIDTHNTLCRRENLRKSMIFAAHTEGNSSCFIARHVSGFPSANLFVDRLVCALRVNWKKFFHCCLEGEHRHLLERGGRHLGQ